MAAHLVGTLVDQTEREVRREGHRCTMLMDEIEPQQRGLEHEFGGDVNLPRP